MRLFFIALTLSYSISGQVYDNFSDGNFTHNPAWSGNTEHFEIDSNLRLHLNAPSENASSHLHLSSNAIENACWELTVKLTFNPSNSNYLDWYLVANDSILETCSEAYFVRLGSSNDDVSLYLRKNNETIKIIDGLDGRVNTNPVFIKIKVERLLGGIWSLWVDLFDEIGWVLEGAVQDDELYHSSYSGLRCAYTPTRSDRFYFDDLSITGMAYVDLSAPRIIYTEILNENHILIEFDSADLSEVQTSQIYVMPDETAASAIIEDGKELTLIFHDPLPINEPFQLELITISDTFGNLMQDTLINFYLYKHQPFDIIINEIMPDPSPVVQLEDAEYIELYNRAGYPIKLTNWMLLIDAHEIYFDMLEFAAHAYILLIDTDDSLRFEEQEFSAMSLPKMNNSEGYIGLFDDQNERIHEIKYHKNWYKNENKEMGGWSLEMMDHENYCAGKSNWMACENTLGGSPGMVNSVCQQNPDTIAPYIAEVIVIDDDEINIHWSENMYDLSLQEHDAYFFSQEISPYMISHLMDETNIKFSNPLEQGVLYEVSLYGIRDCQENNNEYIHSKFVQGLWPEKDSIFINEILFNPKIGGYDYVELYNASDAYIDLSKLLTGNYDTLLNDIVNTKKICEQNIPFAPHSYLALCEDTSWIKLNYASYDSLVLIEVDQLPSFPNTRGSVAIASLAYEMIDMVMYTEDAHFSLLEDVKGVALERLSINTGDWFSAASTENYGTPARKKSQHLHIPKSSAQLEVHPEVFSPNQDGHDDFTNIIVEVKRPLKTSIIVLDKKGFVVGNICSSELITHQSHWIWDGLHENGNELPLGVYMIVAEFTAADGKR